MLIFLTEASTQTNNPFQWDIILDALINWCMSTGVKLVIGILVLFLLFKIVNLLCKRLYNSLQRRNADETLSKVCVQILKMFLRVVLVVTFVGYIGVETASISAVIASAGVGISLALQGALSNFAGGIVIIFTRPFKIGDYITSNGESGTVENIKIFYTELVTVDNKKVLIPNGTLANNVIVNVTANPTRRVDITLPISYDSDIAIAKKCILDLIEKDERIFRDPAPFITISEYARSQINITARVWTKTSDYWGVYWNLFNNIKTEFDKNGIKIPLNQVEVNIKNN